MDAVTLFCVHRDSPSAARAERQSVDKLNRIEYRNVIRDLLALDLASRLSFFLWSSIPECTTPDQMFVNEPSPTAISR